MPQNISSDLVSFDFISSDSYKGSTGSFLLYWDKVISFAREITGEFPGSHKENLKNKLVFKEVKDDYEVGDRIAVWSPSEGVIKLNYDFSVLYLPALEKHSIVAEFMPAVGAAALHFQSVSSSSDKLQLFAGRAFMEGFSQYFGFYLLKSLTKYCSSLFEKNLIKPDDFLVNEILRCYRKRRLGLDGNTCIERDVDETGDIDLPYGLCIDIFEMLRGNSKLSYFIKDLYKYVSSNLQVFSEESASFKYRNFMKFACNTLNLNLKTLTAIWGFEDFSFSDEISENLEDPFDFSPIIMSPYMKAFIADPDIDNRAKAAANLPRLVPGVSDTFGLGSHDSTVLVLAEHEIDPEDSISYAGKEAYILGSQESARLVRYITLPYNLGEIDSRIISLLVPLNTLNNFEYKEYVRSSKITTDDLYYCKLVHLGKKQETYKINALVDTKTQNADSVDIEELEIPLETYVIISKNSISQSYDYVNKTTAEIITVERIPIKKHYNHVTGQNIDVFDPVSKKSGEQVVIKSFMVTLNSLGFTEKSFTTSIKIYDFKGSLKSEVSSKESTLLDPSFYLFKERPLPASVKYIDVHDGVNHQVNKNLISSHANSTSLVLAQKAGVKPSETGFQMADNGDIAEKIKVNEAIKTEVVRATKNEEIVLNTAVLSDFNSFVSTAKLEPIEVFRKFIDTYNSLSVSDIEKLRNQDQNLPLNIQNFPEAFLENPATKEKVSTKSLVYALSQIKSPVTSLLSDEDTLNLAQKVSYDIKTKSLKEESTEVKNKIQATKDLDNQSSTSSSSVSTVSEQTPEKEEKTVFTNIRDFLYAGPAGLVAKEDVNNPVSFLNGAFMDNVYKTFTLPDGGIVPVFNPMGNPRATSNIIGTLTAAATSALIGDVGIVPKTVENVVTDALSIALSEDNDKAFKIFDKTIKNIIPSVESTVFKDDPVAQEVMSKLYSNFISPLFSNILKDNKTSGVNDTQDIPKPGKQASPDLNDPVANPKAMLADILPNTSNKRINFNTKINYKAELEYKPLELAVAVPSELPEQARGSDIDAISVQIGNSKVPIFDFEKYGMTYLNEAKEIGAAGPIFKSLIDFDANMAKITRTLDGKSTTTYMLDKTVEELKNSGVSEASVQNFQSSLNLIQYFDSFTEEAILSKAGGESLTESNVAQKVNSYIVEKLGGQNSAILYKHTISEALDFNELITKTSVNFVSPAENIKFTLGQDLNPAISKVAVTPLEFIVHPVAAKNILKTPNFGGVCLLSPISRLEDLSKIDPETPIRLVSEVVSSVGNLIRYNLSDLDGNLITIDHTSNPEVEVINILKFKNVYYESSGNVSLGFQDFAFKSGFEDSTEDLPITVRLYILIPVDSKNELLINCDSTKKDLQTIEQTFDTTLTQSKIEEESLKTETGRWSYVKTQENSYKSNHRYQVNLGILYTGTLPDKDVQLDIGCSLSETLSVSNTFTITSTLNKDITHSVTFEFKTPVGFDVNATTSNLNIDFSIKNYSSDLSYIVNSTSLKSVQVLEIEDTDSNYVYVEGAKKPVLNPIPDHFLKLIKNQDTDIQWARPDSVTNDQGYYEYFLNRGTKYSFTGFDNYKVCCDVEYSYYPFNDPSNTSPSVHEPRNVWFRFGFVDISENGSSFEIAQTPLVLSNFTLDSDLDSGSTVKDKFFSSVLNYQGYTDEFIGLKIHYNTDRVQFNIIKLDIYLVEMKKGDLDWSKAITLFNLQSSTEVESNFIKNSNSLTSTIKSSKTWSMVSKNSFAIPEGRRGRVEIEFDMLKAAFVSKEAADLGYSDLENFTLKVNNRPFNIKELGKKISYLSEKDYSIILGRKANFDFEVIPNVRAPGVSDDIYDKVGALIQSCININVFKLELLAYEGEKSYLGFNKIDFSNSNEVTFNSYKYDSFTNFIKQGKIYSGSSKAEVDAMLVDIGKTPYNSEIKNGLGVNVILQGLLVDQVQLPPSQVQIPLSDKKYKFLDAGKQYKLKLAFKYDESLKGDTTKPTLEDIISKVTNAVVSLKIFSKYKMISLDSFVDTKVLLPLSTTFDYNNNELELNLVIPDSYIPEEFLTFSRLEVKNSDGTSYTPKKFTNVQVIQNIAIGFSCFIKVENPDFGVIGITSFEKIDTETKNVVSLGVLKTITATDTPQKNLSFYEILQAAASGKKEIDGITLPVIPVRIVDAFRRLQERKTFAIRKFVNPVKPSDIKRIPVTPKTSSSSNTDSSQRSLRKTSKFYIQGNGIQYHFEMMPAVKSVSEEKNQGMQAPGADRGINFRTSINIAKINVPGGFPVYQAMGVNEEIIEFVGAFIGEYPEGYTTNKGFLQDPFVDMRFGESNFDSNGLIAGSSTYQFFRAYQESMNIRNIQLSGTKCKLVIKSGSESEKDGIDIDVDGYIIGFERSIQRDDRVWYKIAFRVTSHSNTSSNKANEVSVETLSEQQQDLNLKREIATLEKDLVGDADKFYTRSTYNAARQTALASGGLIQVKRMLEEAKSTQSREESLRRAGKYNFEGIRYNPLEYSFYDVNGVKVVVNKNDAAKLLHEIESKDKPKSRNPEISYSSDSVLKTTVLNLDEYRSLVDEKTHNKLRDSVVFVLKSYVEPFETIAQAEARKKIIELEAHSVEIRGTSLYITKLTNKYIDISDLQNDKAVLKDFSTDQLKAYFNFVNTVIQLAKIKNPSSINDVNLYTHVRNANDLVTGKVLLFNLKNFSEEKPGWVEESSTNASTSVSKTPSFTSEDPKVAPEQLAFTFSFTKEGSNIKTSSKLLRINSLPNSSPHFSRFAENQTQAGADLTEVVKKSGTDLTFIKTEIDDSTESDKIISSD